MCFFFIKSILDVWVRLHVFAIFWPGLGLPSVLSYKVRDLP